MAEEIVKTINIKVEGATNLKDFNQETENATRTVSSIRKEISGYRDELLNLTKGTKEYNDKVKQIIDAQEEVASVTKIKRQEEEAAAGSIRALQEEYKKLYAVYKELSEEERNNAEGQAMTKHLKEISDKLNETKKAAGDFHDNIGHYAESVTEAFGKMGVSVGALQGPLKLATGGANGLKSAFTALAAHPIIAIITGLVLIFQKAAAAIKNNEEHTQALHSAMAAFQPVIDGVSNAFDALAGVIVKAVGWIGKAAEGIRKAGAAFTDFIGITKGAKQRVEEQIEVYHELADAENAYALQKREVGNLNAIDEAEIARLRDEAAATEDATQKRELLAQAIKLQNTVTERNVKLAEENLRIEKARAEQTANSAEDNERLAKAEQEVNRVREEGAKKTKQLTGQITALDKAQAAAAKAARDEAKKVLDEVKKNSQTEIQILTEKYEREVALLRKYGMDTRDLTRQYADNVNKVITSAQASLLQRTLTDKERRRLVENIIPSVKDFEDQIEIIQDKVGQVMGLTGIAAYGDNGTLLSESAARVLNTLSGEERKAYEETAELNSEVVKLNEAFGLNIRTMDEVNLVIAEFNKEINTINSDKLEYILNLTNTAIAIDMEIFRQMEAEQFKLIDEGIHFLDQEHYKNFSNLFTYWQEYIDYVNSAYNKTQLLGDLERDTMKTRIDQLAAVLGLERERVYLRTDSDEKLAEKERENYEIEKRNNQKIVDMLLNSELDKLQILQDYYDAKAQLQEYDLNAESAYFEREKDLLEERRSAWWDFGSTVKDSLSTIMDTYSSLIKEQIQEGNISEKEMERKKENLKTLEKIQLAVAIAGIVADTTAGIISVNKAYAAELVNNAQTAAATGVLSVATKAALDTKSNVTRWVRISSLVAQGVAAATAAAGKTASGLNSIANMGGGDSTAGASVVPQMIDSTPYSYTRNVQTDAEREEMLNTPIVVSVVDIDNAQNMRRVRVQEASW